MYKSSSLPSLNQVRWHQSKLSRTGSTQVLTKSVGVGTDTYEGMTIEVPCSPCQATISGSIPAASWYCQQCDELICHECKYLHTLFKNMRSHLLTSLHPPCQICKKKRRNSNSNFFCIDCQEFLCDNCRLYHKLAPILENHNIISSKERIKENNDVPITKRRISQRRHITKGETSLHHRHTKKTELPVIRYTKRQNENKTRTNLIKFLDQLTGLSMSTQESLFELDVEDKKSSSTRKSLVTVTLPLSRRIAKYVTKFDVQVFGDTKPRSITGSAFLPDLRLLLVDNRNKKLKIFDAKFNFVTHEKFSYEPWSITALDSSEVAVVVGNHIVRLTVDGEITEKGTMALGVDCYGISYINKDSIAVAGMAGSFADMFDTYNMLGSHLSRLSIGQRWVPFHLAMDEKKTRAYVSTALAHTVTAIDIRLNKILFTYTHKDLRWPEGLAVDKEDNLYICGRDSNNIHQVSPDGKCIQVLLTQKDGLNMPQTIAFAPKGDTFIVGSSGIGAGKNALVFKMV